MKNEEIIEIKDEILNVLQQEAFGDSVNSQDFDKVVNCMYNIFEARIHESLEDFTNWLIKQDNSDKWKPTKKIVECFLNDTLYSNSESNVRCLHCRKSIDDCKNNQCLNPKI